MKFAGVFLLWLALALPALAALEWQGPAWYEASISGILRGPFSAYADCAKFAAPDALKQPAYKVACVYMAEDPHGQDPTSD